FWPGENVIGKRIRVHVNEPAKLPREVVGVVGDVHLHRLDMAAAPVIYVPHTQYGPETMTVMARTSGNPLQAVSELKAILKSTAPGVAMGQAQTLDDVASA